MKEIKEKRKESEELELEKRKKKSDEEIERMFKKGMKMNYVAKEGEGMASVGFS